MSRMVRVQELIGRRVRDGNGKVVGRIQEIKANWRGKECYIDEFELGGTAILERLGIAGTREPMKIPWQEMDLSDPEQPRLRSAAAEPPPSKRR